MENFNYQVVLQFHDEEDNKIIFAGSTDMSLDVLLVDLLAELKNSKFYDVINVIYQPANLDSNGTQKT